LFALIAFVAYASVGCSSTPEPPVAEGEPTAEIAQALVPSTSSEYKLPAVVDPDILSDRVTELWARVYRPIVLLPGVRYPLLVFLHGNHQTCGHGSNPRIDDNSEYTVDGTCPPGYVVAPSHNGYTYIATQLASAGYIVVSVNANRGINLAGGTADDWGLNLARGRLVLKHLTLLSQWDRGVLPTPPSLATDLTNHIDFSQVGLFGHSRGGEGMRAAYQQYLDAGSPWPARIVTPVKFAGIFEVGPVDGQTSRVLDMGNTRWSVLLPMCDGDVFDLEGMRPYDRAQTFTSESSPGFKSTLTAWGTNHNYYNTEWQTSDSGGCNGAGNVALFSSGPGISGSPQERQVSSTFATAFFLGNVGAGRDPSQNAIFDPTNPLPSALTSVTRVDRGFTLSPDANVTLRLEDFVNPTGTSTFGQPNDASGLDITHGPLPEHDSELSGGTITWMSGGTNTFFQTNFAPIGSSISLTQYGTLDLRVDLASSSLNVTPTTDFSVQLVNAQNRASVARRISQFVSLTGPVGGPGGPHSMLQTARIPLVTFGMPLNAIRGVRLTFNVTPTGELYVANIRATRNACAVTPKLDLKVREVAQSANQITYRFQVYNRDTTAITLSDLSTSLWISDPTSSLTSQVSFGGNVVDPSGAFQFGSVATTSSTFHSPTECVASPNRVADWSATVASTDTRTIPPNGGAWVDGEFNVHRTDFSSFASLTDDYSQTPAYQGGTISDATFPTVYGDDTHFVLYWRGAPVSEFVTATNVDLASGKEPPCLAACVGSVNTSTSVVQASTLALSSSFTPGVRTPPVAAPAALFAQGTIVSIGATLVPQSVGGGTDIEVTSPTPFQATDDLYVLHVGSVDVPVSRYPDPASTQRLIFTLTPQQFAAVRTGDKVTVTGARTLWNLGTLTL
jgi:hypothetical protein